MARGRRRSSSGVELAGRAERVDARAPERLVGVDVPEPRDRALVEQRALDRRAAPCEPLRQPRGGEARPERLDAEPDAQVRIELAGLEQPPRAEAAHVAVGEPAAVVERDRGPRVRVVGRAVGEERAGHAQMREQRAAALEADDQVLAAPLDGGDALALELGRDLARVVRRGQPVVADLDLLEPSPLEDGRKPGANRLDLGQLRHAASVVTAAFTGTVPVRSTPATRPLQGLSLLGTRGS